MRNLIGLTYSVKYLCMIKTVSRVNKSLLFYYTLRALSKESKFNLLANVKLWLVSFSQQIRSPTSSQLKFATYVLS